MSNRPEAESRCDVIGVFQTEKRFVIKKEINILNKLNIGVKIYSAVFLNYFKTGKIAEKSIFLFIGAHFGISS